MRISDWSSDVCSSDLAVADLMMTVPNRSLRLLDDGELREYGLSGTNAVQDDLDRSILERKCGDEFVKRRDAFLHAHDRQCRGGGGQDAVDACELATGDEYGIQIRTGRGGAEEGQR